MPEQRRAAFVSEGERIDPISGETVGWFPRYQFSLSRQTNDQMEKYAAKTDVHSGWSFIRIPIDVSVDHHICF